VIRRHHFHNEVCYVVRCPTLTQISVQFTGYDVERSGGGYIILNRSTSDPIARLHPIPDTDRFELFYWSNMKGRWTIFGNMGRMKLTLESAHDHRERSDVSNLAPPMIQKNWPKLMLDNGRQVRAKLCGERRDESLRHATRLYTLPGGEHVTSEPSLIAVWPPTHLNTIDCI
jgi:hypothetical protein